VQGIAIVGPGLIGTSVALAARRRWPDAVIKTVDRGESLSGIGHAMVVVLSAPVDVILDTIPALPRVIQSEALVIDTGSTKRAIMAAAANAGLRQFVGGHPMAGGTGVSEARADLFDGRPWFLTSPDAPDALRRASQLVDALGARPVVLSDRGEEHDRLMAAISHLPQVTATMLMTVVARTVGTEHLQWAGSGLRDTTRLATSSAAVWQSILSSNKDELRPLLKSLASELATFADRLDDHESVQQVFDEANRAKTAAG